MKPQPKQYQQHETARQYGIPIHIRRESTQKGSGLFAGNTQHKRLEEIVMYI